MSIHPHSFEDKTEKAVELPRSFLPGRNQPVPHMFRHVPCNRNPAGFLRDEFRSVPVHSSRFRLESRRNLTGEKPVGIRLQGTCRNIWGTDRNRSVPTRIRPVPAIGMIDLGTCDSQKCILSSWSWNQTMSPIDIHSRKRSEFCLVSSRCGIGHLRQIRTKWIYLYERKFVHSSSHSIE